jgi:hypothetical protein
MIERVNGYVCRTCEDVGYAKRHIDPAHPKDGPNGRDARVAEAQQDRGPAVLFQGGLGAQRVPRSPFVPGASTDFRV